MVPETPVWFRPAAPPPRGRPPTSPADHCGEAMVVGSAGLEETEARGGQEGEGLADLGQRGAPGDHGPAGFGLHPPFEEAALEQDGPLAAVLIGEDPGAELPAVGFG